MPPGGPPLPHTPPKPPKPKPKPHTPYSAPPRRVALAHDPYAPYEKGAVGSTAQDQATQIMEQFLSVMGWPSGIDANKLTLEILKQNLETSPEQSYNFLFKQISSKLQKANPNAEFGLNKDQYVSQTNALKDQYESYTGTSDIPPDVLRMAIDQGWTQTEMLTFLQKDHRFTNPADLPWLQQGIGYRDVRSQFVQTYGKAPTDIKQLASWFDFKSGAQQVGAGQQATVAPNPGAQKGLSQSEIR
jgi:hypothetical protein